MDFYIMILTSEGKNQTGKEEMKSSYIDYSMSVIVARALPDVRYGMPLEYIKKVGREQRQLFIQ